MKVGVASFQQTNKHKALLLPHFIIIGAMKSGTTTLYRQCAAHPDIDMSREKETNFFLDADGSNPDLEGYSKKFSRIHAIRGEASPNYTKQRDFPGVPARMAAILPDAKLVYIVRDPIVRAEAQFRHGVLHGALPATLEGFLGGHEYQHILDASCYAAQLEEFLKYFPKEAVLILDFDDLLADPQSVLDRLWEHIGAAPVRINRGMALNDSASLSRVPASILSFAHSRVGRALAGAIGNERRDQIRAALSFGKQRIVPPFPNDLKMMLRRDLVSDTARFREMTGLPFSGWSV